MPYKDPKMQQAVKDRWRRENPEKHKESVRWANMKAKYGLSRDEWYALYDAQGGLCAICRRDTPGGRGVFHVDHCHATGIVRGLLCNWCNRGLGMFGDNPELVRTALTYLEQPR